jgi:hypothetical protein
MLMLRNDILAAPITFRSRFQQAGTRNIFTILLIFNHVIVTAAA